MSELDLEAIKAQYQQAAAGVEAWLPLPIVRAIEATTALIAEVERLQRRYPCDGGCNWADGPQEECSLHGRTPAEMWEALDKGANQRDALQARLDAVREIAENSVGGFVASAILKALEGDGE